ncbi:D-amino-acid oxidase [Pyrrhoderma noxium]|uniref:D-amino-acid oxidase n=1 Tax=Pyrrhoderma noxium TaxID=2282107 RepID=A0A286UM41_9AGAM|nr:D-amino-acid oxidase [Pyrrhoderma noxium]
MRSSQCQLYKGKRGTIKPGADTKTAPYVTYAWPITMSTVIVLGAGVVGLSTAIKIQESGHSVTIVAETFPDEPKNIRYTSWWSGAHHVSLSGDDTRQQAFDRETFKIMWEMSEPGKDSEECFLRIPQTEYYAEKRYGANCLEVMPEYRVLAQDELITGAVSGVSFNTLTIDMPVYLLYLLRKFQEGGGKIVRAAIHHIAQLAEGTYSEGVVPKAIVICAGLGARLLGGVEDKDVYPVRGQTVILRAPWVRRGLTISNLETGLWTYIIPRRSGGVIVGGTKAENDWEPKPRPETTIDILTRGLALCPQLSPSYKEGQSELPTVEDVKSLIIEEGCGLRPARKGGIRLETASLETVTGQKIPLVYNYGHGSYGVQSSWGSSIAALKLLKEVIV